MYKRLELILRYWSKVISNKDHFTYQVYNIIRKDADFNIDYNGFNWAFYVIKLLCDLGFSYMWYVQDFITPNINIVIQRLYNQYIQLKNCLCGVKQHATNQPT